MRLRRVESFRTGGTNSNMQLSMPIPKTPEGRVYRFSPNEKAHPRHFQIGDIVPEFVFDESRRPRMRLDPISPFTVCPYSGVIAENENFTHPEDRKAAIAMLEHAYVQDFQDAIDEMFSGVARKSKGTLTYKKGTRGARPRPYFGRPDLMRALVCDHCGRDYAVYAISLFCPGCGAPNLSLHFRRESELVAKQVDLAEAQDSANRELAYRLLGNAHEDVLTAFEAALKAVYLHAASNLSEGAPPAKPPGNDFQNIEKGKGRFSVFDFDPFGELTGAEAKALALNIQKRHVIGHNLGIVDEKFAKNAADAKLGETVHLVGTDIREFAGLCAKVIARLDDWLAGQAAPALPDAPAEEKDEMPERDRLVGEFGPLASKLGRWMSRSSEDGLPDHVSGESIKEAFPDESESELLEAIAELEVDGCVTCTRFISGEFPRVRTTEDLFLTFDPPELEARPDLDALKVAEIVVSAQEGSFSAAELHEQSGLPLRRFNPALGMIVREVGDGRVSGEHAQGYAVRHFFVVDVDRVSIKRLMKRLKG